jgi:hypothetical protein
VIEVSQGVTAVNPSGLPARGQSGEDGGGRTDSSDEMNPGQQSERATARTQSVTPRDQPLIVIKPSLNVCNSHASDHGAHNHL